MIKPLTKPLGNAPPRDRPVIYVVDDEATLLELASIILQAAGYEACTFRDPEAALSAYTTASARPALIITDYAMHQMSGVELLRACRRLDPEQKVLLVSGTIGEDIPFAEDCKPDGFLGKPYHARQLLERVKSFVPV